MGPLYSHIQRLTVTFRKLLILTLKILSEITYMHVSHFCTMSVLCSDGEGNITNSYLMSDTWCEFSFIQEEIFKDGYHTCKIECICLSKGFKCLRMHGVNAHVLFEKKKGACKTKIIMYMYFDCMGDFQHAALI